MMHKKVYFRADASESIGYGHFIRTLALADMLKDEFDCTFFTQIPNAFQRKEAETVCKLVELPSDNSKFEDFLRYLDGNEIVVLDNYFYTSEYEKAIKQKGCKLVSIGSNNRHFHADIVVNFTNLQPLDFSAESYTKFCIGLEWTLLRKPFYQERNEKKAGIIICIGGTDQFAFSEGLYDIISTANSYDEVKIIASDRIGNDRIRKFERRGINLLLNQTALQMAEHFAQANIAVVSASSVAIEALSQKTSVIAGYYVENQMNIYQTLNNEGYVWGIGAFSDPEMRDRLLSAIFHIKGGENKRFLEVKNTVQRYKTVFSTLC